MQYNNVILYNIREVILEERPAKHINPVCVRLYDIVLSFGVWISVSRQTVAHSEFTGVRSFFVLYLY